MDIYWKGISLGFASLILCITLDRQSKDYSAILALAATGMLAISSVRLFSPLVDFIRQLESLSQWHTSYLPSLLKIFCIGLTGDISAAICTDSGSSSIGKGIQILSNAAIFYLSIPIYSSLLTTVQHILTII